MNDKTAPAGELTDEQIEDVRQQPQHHHGEFEYRFDELSFARAVIIADRALRPSPAVGDAAMPVVAYLRADRNGQPVWAEDCVCQDPIFPSDPDGSDAGDVSMPMVRLADAQARSTMDKAAAPVLGCAHTYFDAATINKDFSDCRAQIARMSAAVTTRPLSTPPPAHGEYWPGQGGRFICTVAASEGLPERHLICSIDEAEDLTFGPYLDVPGATSHLDGRANTAALLASSKEHPAAAWTAAYTADGHIDFHLPSRHDLLLAYIHARAYFSQDDDYYWTSTQVSRYYAFVKDFEDGYSFHDLKDNGRRVRAFRWVHLTA